MGVVIVVGNHKGGVGKTTISLNLFSGLVTIYNRNCLAIDLDPQQNLSLALGVVTENYPTSFDLLTGNASIEECINISNLGYLIGADAIQASSSLSIIAEIGDWEYLRNTFRSVKGEYDFIIIDTPPTLGPVMLAALIAADFLLIPVEGSIFSIQSQKAIFNTLEAVRSYNPDLKPYFLRSNVKCSKSDEYLNSQLEENAGSTKIPILSTIIRHNVHLQDSINRKMNVFFYKSRSGGARDFKKLAAEMISIIEGAQVLNSFPEARCITD